MGFSARNLLLRSLRHLRVWFFARALEMIITSAQQPSAPLGLVLSFAFLFLLLLLLLFCFSKPGAVWGRLSVLWSSSKVHSFKLNFSKLGSLSIIFATASASAGYERLTWRTLKAFRVVFPSNAFAKMVTKFFSQPHADSSFTLVMLGAWSSELSPRHWKKVKWRGTVVPACRKQHKRRSFNNFSLACLGVFFFLVFYWKFCFCFFFLFLLLGVSLAFPLLPFFFWVSFGFSLYEIALVKKDSSDSSIAGDPFTPLKISFRKLWLSLKASNISISACSFEFPVPASSTSSKMLSVLFFRKHNLSVARLCLV